MKKTFGISLLSAMLILGQPFTAFADTTGPRTINFEDIGSIVAEKNLEAHINENERLRTKVSFADLKRNIKNLEDDLDDINSQRGQVTGGNTAVLIGLGTEKRIMLDNLKVLERTVVDKPTLEAITDLKASMSDASQTRYAESKFIGYNQSNLDSSDITLKIKNLKNQLVTMQLKESLGLITSNNMNDLKTSIVDMQTKLESTKLQQELYERELKNVFNDHENTLVFGKLPSVNQDFIVQDKVADFEKAYENSYALKLQEQQIVLLQSALDRAKKDNGLTSNKYRLANYDLMNANLRLSIMKDSLRSDYDSMLDDIAKKQSNLRLAEQTFNDKKVALSQAQVRMSLGMFSQLEMDTVTTDLQVGENSVKAKQIELFNAEYGYEWFLKGMPRA